VPDPAGSPCLLCERIARIDAGQYPYAVATLATGYVNLMENQFYEGTTEFVSRVCVAELHELDPDFRARYLEQMALVAQAVWRAFEPRKLNYEALGNAVPHLHWRIVPRLADDPNPGGPIWENEEFVAQVRAGGNELPRRRRDALRARLRSALDELV
jgi:diadenosine tetraphosphate (Ap4A) HIT family hydrolase